MSILDAKRIAPVFIAHRGYSLRYPENTLLSMTKAFENGACYVECDVQLTKDKVPVVLHDSNLKRLSGKTGTIEQLTAQELEQYSAGYPERFGEKYSNEKIATLDEFVQLIKQWPQRAAFVEIKRSSIRNFGLAVVLDHVLPLLRQVNQQVAVISFNEELVHHLKAQQEWSTGWITEEWSDDILQKASQMNPDFFFVDYECLPAGYSNFQSEDFQWVLYEIDDPEHAEQFVEKGVGFIETNDIKKMLAYEKFSGSGCS